MRDVVAGVGLGSLVGLLIGLAASEVVGTVLGALTALLAAFFGLQGGGKLLPAAPAGRIAGFAFAAVAAVLAGVWLRTADALAPSAMDRAEAWRAIGVEEERVRDLVVFERLGFAPGGVIESEALVAAARRSTALFAGEAAASCEVLTVRTYPGADALASALEAEGGPWGTFAAAVPADLDDPARERVYRAAIDLACGP